jgi:hypothetical protein
LIAGFTFRLSQDLSSAEGAGESQFSISVRQQAFCLVSGHDFSPAVKVQKNAALAVRFFYWIFVQILRWQGLKCLRENLCA